MTSRERGIRLSLALDLLISTPETLRILLVHKIRETNEFLTLAGAALVVPLSRFRYIPLCRGS